MFGLKKTKEKFSVLAPIEGEVIPITEVKDNVFAQKMMGDGFAIIPESGANQVLAPITGKIVAIADSKHAIGIQSMIDEKIEVLIHVGLETVDLQGKGFASQIKIGQKVEAGTSLLTLDLTVMQEASIDLTTMVIFTSGIEKTIDLRTQAHEKVNARAVILDNL